ncbi:hypothetical protein B0J11DRAFT_576341 [Dendryphion nanum]|uniref:Uncharacterized protein n=1 Tax=Dendryphion nanum TaxID=256645 RepID=A0A9P9EFS4_9PLEO|nr:hypothetical protein B0J11DRAFT_576341 [Dendryphion nanum]
MTTNKILILKYDQYQQKEQSKLQAANKNTVRPQLGYPLIPYSIKLLSRSLYRLQIMPGPRHPTQGNPKDWHNAQVLHSLEVRRREAIRRITEDKPWTELERTHLAQLKIHDFNVATASAFHKEYEMYTLESICAEYLEHKPLFDAGKCRHLFNENAPGYWKGSPKCRHVVVESSHEEPENTSSSDVQELTSPQPFSTCAVAEFNKSNITDTTKAEIELAKLNKALFILAGANDASTDSHDRGKLPEHIELAKTLFALPELDEFPSTRK